MARKDAPHAPKARARKRAIQALYQWSMTEQEPGEIIRQFRDAQDFSKVDVDYFETLTRGTVDKRDELDEALTGCSDRPLQQLDPLELSILRCGAYELIHHIEVPYRVALNEAVGLAREFGSEQSPGYVNGVLDRLSRQVRAAEHDAGA